MEKTHKEFKEMLEADQKVLSEMNFADENNFVDCFFKTKDKIEFDWQLKLTKA